MEKGVFDLAGGIVGARDCRYFLRWFWQNASDPVTGSPTKAARAAQSRDGHDRCRPCSGWAGSAFNAGSQIAANEAAGMTYAGYAYFCRSGQLDMDDD
jgi:hypothetical protein